MVKSVLKKPKRLKLGRIGNNMTKSRIFKNERPDWAKKMPRSSRICYRCTHKYSSHVPACGKILERKPERKECTCRLFVKNQYELDLAVKFEAREDRERAEKNALKAQEAS